MHVYLFQMEQYPVEKYKSFKSSEHHHINIRIY